MLDPVRRTVLVVDDEDYVAKLDKTILNRRGFDVLIAQTAADALSLARSHSAGIALIIVDFGLPDMNGIELIPFLRAAAPGVKIMVSSGYLADDLVNPFAFDIAFLQKPYTADRLVQAVERTLKAA